MLHIYTSYNCVSCKKAMKWFEAHGLLYQEENFFTQDLTEDNVLHMLKYTQEGFIDIVSERSKVYIRHQAKIGEMKTSELVEFIIENPSVLKRPIIVDDIVGKVIVGYNEYEYQDLI